jgi:hypothetical protein
MDEKAGSGEGGTTFVWLLCTRISVPAQKNVMVAESRACFTFVIGGVDKCFNAQDVDLVEARFSPSAERPCSERLKANQSVTLVERHTKTA